MKVRHFLPILVRFLEMIMSDYTKLNSNIETLSLKVDALLLKANAPPPAPVVIDEQPSVDAIDAAIVAMIAKIDPPTV